MSTGKVTAALVYGGRLHVINLFVRPAEGRDGPWAWRAATATTWCAGAEGGLEFWAVSDLNRAELDQFRDLFEARAEG